jgi:hypothetical protein
LRLQSWALALGPAAAVEWMHATPGGRLDGGYESWFLGYLTGFNVLAASANYDITGSAPNASTLDWLKLYCRNHPMDAGYEAAAALIGEMASRLPSASSGATPDTIIPTRRR